MSNIKVNNGNGTYSEYFVPMLEGVKDALKSNSAPIVQKKPRKTKTIVTSKIIAQVEDLVFTKEVPKARACREIGISESSMWRICKRLAKKHARNNKPITTISVHESGELELLKMKHQAIKTALKYLLESL